MFYVSCSFMLQNVDGCLHVHESTQCSKASINERARFEVFTVVTMKNGVFWDVKPCGSCKNRRFGGT
jgi:hypothetical protein